MKKILALILSLVMLVGACASLTACSEPENPGAQIAVYLGEEIYDFDPTDYYVDDAAAQVLSLIYEPLFRLDDDGDLKRALADDYEIIKEERTIRIEIRETYWSDNVPVTADDFLFAWRDILLNPDGANPAASLLYDIEGAVDVKKGTISPYKLGVTKLNSSTIEIKYREGADPKALLKNLASVATSPVRQDKYENSEGFWTKLSDTMVFNGPFKIVELDYEDQSPSAAFKLERNVGYHQDYEAKDYDDEVNPYKVYSFYNADGNEIKCTYAQLASKTVFFMGDASLADRIANKNSAEVADTFSTYSYVFNTENPLFAVKEVRQALSLVIDRDAIIAAITFGTAASGFVPAVIEDAATEESFRNGNALIATGAKLTEAQELIDSVADRIKSYDKTIVLTVNDDVESLKIAELVAAAWESLGFTVEVEALGSMLNYVTENELEVYDSAIQYIVKSKALGTASKYDSGFSPAKKARYDQKTKTFYSNFDVIAVDWQFYTNDAFTGLASLASSFNKGERACLGGWSNNEYNAHVASALRAASVEDRMASLHAAEKLLIEEMPVAPIVFNQNFCFISKDLSGVKIDGFGNFVFTDAKLKKYENYLNDTRFSN